MGLDLRFLPLDHDTPSFGFSHTVLEGPRGYELPKLLEPLPHTDPPKNWTCYVARLANGESGYGRKAADAYGGPLKCVPAGELAKVMSRKRVYCPPATLAYLQALPPETRVVLDWH